MNRPIQPIRGIPTSLLYVLLALSIILGLAGCAGLGDIIKPPEARIASVEIVRVDFTSVSLRLNVEIDNPNPVGLTLSAYDWNLDVSEKRVLEGRVEEGISLRANGVSTLPIPLDIRFDNLAAAGVSLRGTDSLLLGMQLGLEVALPYMGSVRLDVGAKTEIPVLKPPVVRPERIRVDRISLSGADITLTANVKNPNSRMLTVQTLEGRLIVGGREWGLIGLGGDASLPPGDERTISLRASVDFGEVGRSAWSLLSGTGSADVRLIGDMDIDVDVPGFVGNGIPLETDASVSIVR
jgi:LEA14-like dessication related protein